jgi:hypothetical protein
MITRARPLRKLYRQIPGAVGYDPADYFEDQPETKTAGGRRRLSTTVNGVPESNAEPTGRPTEWRSRAAA